MIVLFIASQVGASGVATNLTQAAAREVAFRIFWPPVDPAAATETAPLLKGSLKVHVASTNTEHLAQLRIVLTRPSDEASRKLWNSQLAFPEYDWMRYVRVWDAGQQWLWPNLPYLLRAHGEERVERYGGVDPGKGVDNDFAAVLIRKYDTSGERESEETRRLPLVSAAWYPATEGKVDKQTVVHVARSDEFTLHLGRPGEVGGRAGIWLIYADFMGAKPPEAWPKTLEFAGGILAYFDFQWETNPSGGLEVKVSQRTPPWATGFNWQGWMHRTRLSSDPTSTARLTDTPVVAGVTR